jgi:hypothetical protein
MYLQEGIDNKQLGWPALQSVTACAVVESHACSPHLTSPTRLNPTGMDATAHVDQH